MNAIGLSAALARLRFCLCLALLAGQAAAADPARDAIRVKVALITKCLQHVEWPDSGASARAPEFRIGLLGADKTTSAIFAEMSKHVSLNGKPLRILTVPGLDNVRGMEVLYADAGFADLGPQVWKAVEKRGIFLVTDRFPDKKYVMLNIAMDRAKESFTFEINRANTIMEGFALKPDLLLLGGSEIDVRALYRKMRDDLMLQEENVRKKQAQLDDLAQQVESMQRKIDLYAASMAAMETGIRESEKTIAGQEARQKNLDDQIDAQQKVLAEKSRELAREVAVLKAQRVEIETEQANIERMRGVIGGLSADISEKERLIGESRRQIERQEAEIRVQGVRISTQLNLIFLMVGTTIVLMALGGAVFAAYRFKRVANENLERKVRQRTEELESAFRKQRELEATLHQSEKLKSIGQLAGGIAHDFNNQLGGILGYADLLHDRLGGNITLRGFAANIITLVERSRDLTSQLLAFARKGQYQCVPVDIHAVVQEVAALLERTVGSAITVRQALYPGEAFTLGDPSQLQNAILNLGINARDAMPEGGELILATDVQDPPAGMDPGIEGARFIRLSVTDTGTGIDAETMKHIFEPFYTTKAVGKGTGMGLAAVFGTVQAHKGFIDVASRPGEGSVFSMYLPLSNQVRTAEAPAGKPPMPEAKRLNIMLVDDEEFMRDLCSSLFQSMGHAITTFPRGKEALEAYRTGWRSVDLVILDMVMPGMSGKEVFAEMKAINPDIIAILASGYSAEAEVQDILASGVRGFLPKPFGKSDLIGLIKDIFALAPA
jgi:signal transduction histidine kinase